MARRLGLPMHNRNVDNKNVELDSDFTVSQAVRFRSNSMKCHEDTVSLICEYLYHTKTKGMTMKASGNSFKVYADADF